MSNDAHPAGRGPADGHPDGAHPLRSGANDTGTIDHVEVENSPRFREL